MSQLSKLWDQVKAWFKYSETILIARLQVVIGFFTAAFAAIDWSQFSTLNWATGFTNKQLLWLGVGALVSGIVTEIARRRNSDL